LTVIGHVASTDGNVFPNLNVIDGVKIAESVADEAHSLGLIDEVGAFDAAYESKFGEAVKCEVAVCQISQERLSLEGLL